MENKKPITKSKTMWFGLFVMVGTWLSNNTDILMTLVPTEYHELAGYFIGIGIWFFRYVTKEPIDKVIEKF